MNSREEIDGCEEDEHIVMGQSKEDGSFCNQRGFAQGPGGHTALIYQQELRLVVFLSLPEHLFIDAVINGALLPGYKSPFLSAL